MAPSSMIQSELNRKCSWELSDNRGDLMAPGAYLFFSVKLSCKVWAQTAPFDLSGSSIFPDTRALPYCLDRSGLVRLCFELSALIH